MQRMASWHQRKVDDGSFFGVQMYMCAADVDEKDASKDVLSNPLFAAPSSGGDRATRCGASQSGITMTSAKVGEFAARASRMQLVALFGHVDLMAPRAVCWSLAERKQEVEENMEATQQQMQEHQSQLDEKMGSHDRWR